MDTVGKRLLQARTAKQLSVSELAEITRIKAMQVKAIEQDDFSVVPAVAYGKGFVKLLAQHLDLDADELVAQYLEQVGAQPLAPKARASRISNPSAPTPPAPAPSPAPSAPEPFAPIVEPEEVSRGSVDDGAVERTAADRSAAGGTLSLGGLSGNDDGGRSGMLRRWSLVAGLAVLLVILLAVPRLLRSPGSEPGDDEFHDLPELTAPRSVEPLFPYIELPESSS